MRTNILLFSFLFITATSLLFPTTIASHPLHVRRRLHVAQQHCSNTLHPSLCVSTVRSIRNLSSKTLPDVISSVIKRTVHEVHRYSDKYTGVLRKGYRDLHPRERLALVDCLELFGNTVDDLQSALKDLHPTNVTRHFYDLQTSLSASITNQYTCLDGFSHTVNDTVMPTLEMSLRHISGMVSNSLAMSQSLPRKSPTLPSYATTSSRYEVEAFEEYGGVWDGFPAWVTPLDRKLLTEKVDKWMISMVVASDGSGHHKTIGEALEAAPSRSDSRFVIYIKAGAYFENVEVDKTKTNIMFIGDGIGKTVVKASRNMLEGWTTFRSATVAVNGNGFLARDITIENASGPEKQQAVALRSDSDFSVFYKCSFVGYQDTLYVHSYRQFYKACDVYGTVDFIFGDAAALFHSCNLYARLPLPNQKNVFTAQGRQDPNQNTGISIQFSKVAAAVDLIPVVSEFKSFLGRPWKQYSRTVFMSSYLGELIDPAGWLEWDGDFALSTLYYGEYKNRGPGSDTNGRVNWPGYRVINDSLVARQFTVDFFMQGEK